MIKKIKAVLLTGLLIYSSQTLSIYAQDIYKKEIIQGTSKEISNKLNNSEFKETKEVVLVSEKSLVDAISATPLAYAKDAPIMTTEWKKIDRQMKQYFEDAGVEKVTIIGGLGSISQTSENEIENMGIDVDRIYGLDRHETSLNIAREINKISPFSEAIVLSRSADIKNGVAIYSYAAKNNIPIIWGEDTNLDKIGKYLNAKGVEKVYAIGNSLEFKKELEIEVKNVEYLKEIKKIDSNIEWIKKFYGEENMTGKVYAINGEMGRYLNDTDYISLGVVAAKQNIPILVSSDTLTRYHDKYLEETNVNELIEVGVKVEEFNIVKTIKSKDFLSRVGLIALLFIIFIRILLLNRKSV